MFDPRDFRREKRTPNQDAWHVLRVGVCIGLVLFIVLPLAMG
jgi:hypothetical protein